MAFGGQDNRNVNVTLGANVDPYTSAMDKAAQSTTKVAKAVLNMAEKADNALKGLGHRMEAVFTGSIAGMGVYIEATNRLQQAFRNAAATAALTGQSLQQLEMKARNMAKAFPASAEEIGQLMGEIQNLGVRGTALIGQFTETALRMGAATGESSQQLIAQLTDLMKTMGSAYYDVSNYGSALVQLAKNNGVAASSILQFAQAIEPVATALGMTQTQVMGLSAAFQKAGLEGGSAATTFITVMSNIQQAVATTSPALRTFGAAMGMNTDQIKQMVATNPVAFFEKFTDSITHSGTRGIQILNELGLAGPRTFKNLQTINGSVIAQNIDQANDAFTKNTALAKSSNAAWNNLGDAMAKLRHTIAEFAYMGGQGIAPIFKVAVDALNRFLEVIQAIARNPVMRFIGETLSGLVTAMSGLGGSVILTSLALFKFASIWRVIGSTPVFTFFKAMKDAGGAPRDISNLSNAMQMLYERTYKFFEIFRQRMPGENARMGRFTSPVFTPIRLAAKKIQFEMEEVYDTLRPSHLLHPERRDPNKLNPLSLMGAITRIPKIFATAFKGADETMAKDVAAAQGAAVSIKEKQRRIMDALRTSSPDLNAYFTRHGFQGVDADRLMDKALSPRAKARQRRMDDLKEQAEARAEAMRAMEQHLREEEAAGARYTRREREFMLKGAGVMAVRGVQGVQRQRPAQEQAEEAVNPMRHVLSKMQDLLGNAYGKIRDTIVSILDDIRKVFQASVDFMVAAAKRAQMQLAALRGEAVAPAGDDTVVGVDVQGMPEVERLNNLLNEIRGKTAEATIKIKEVVTDASGKVQDRFRQTISGGAIASPGFIGAESKKIEEAARTERGVMYAGGYGPIKRMFLAPQLAKETNERLSLIERAAGGRIGLATRAVGREASYVAGAGLGMLGGGLGGVAGMVGNLGMMGGGLGFAAMGAGAFATWLMSTAHKGEQWAKAQDGVRGAADDLAHSLGQVTGSSKSLIDLLNAQKAQQNANKPQGLSDQVSFEQANKRALNFLKGSGGGGLLGQRSAVQTLVNQMVQQNGGQALSADQQQMVQRLAQTQFGAGSAAVFANNGINFGGTTGASLAQTQLGQMQQATRNANAANMSLTNGGYSSKYSQNILTGMAQQITQALSQGTPEGNKLAAGLLANAQNYANQLNAQSAGDGDDFMRALLRLIGKGSNGLDFQNAGSLVGGLNNLKRQGGGGIANMVYNQLAGNLQGGGVPLSQAQVNNLLSAGAGTGTAIGSTAFARTRIGAMVVNRPALDTKLQSTDPALVQQGINTVNQAMHQQGSTLAESRNAWLQYAKAIGDTTDTRYKAAMAAIQQLNTALSGQRQFLSQFQQFGAMISDAQHLSAAGMTDQAQQATEQAAQMANQQAMDLKNNLIQVQDTQRQMRRSTEDHYRQLGRMNRDYNIQLRETLYQRGVQLREERYSFNEQIRQMVRETALGNSAFDPYSRVQGAYTESAQGILGNLQQQQGYFQATKSGMDRLRGMGLSNDVIQALGLDDPKNFQQVETLVQQLGADPKLVQQFNKSIQGRLDIAKGLTLDPSNDKLNDIKRQFDHQAKVEAQAFDHSMEQTKQSFQRQLNDFNSDFELAAQRMGEDMQLIGREITMSVDQIVSQGLNSTVANLRRAARNIRSEMGTINVAMTSGIGATGGGHTGGGGPTNAAGYSAAVGHMGKTQSDGTRAMGTGLLGFASQLIGDPYVYGANTADPNWDPSKGFDCSALTQYVYKQFGVSLGRTTEAQYGQSKHIAAKNARAGDLVFYDADGRHPGHVGIYLGNGQMLDAPNSNAVVRVEGIWPGAYFGRVLPDNFGKNINKSVAAVRGKPVPMALGSILTAPQTVLAGEAGPEAIIPLNTAGGQFMSKALVAPVVKTIAQDFLHPVLGVDRRKWFTGWQHRTHHGYNASAAHASNMSYTDSSTTFTGDITVKSNDPKDMAKKLEAKKKLDRLRRPVRI